MADFSAPRQTAISLQAMELELAAQGVQLAAIQAHLAAIEANPGFPPGHAAAVEAKLDALVLRMRRLERLFRLDGVDTLHPDDAD